VALELQPEVERLRWIVGAREGDHIVDHVAEPGLAATMPSIAFAGTAFVASTQRCAK
jgi:hypothetical protein